MIRRLSDEEARFVSPVDAHQASPLHERLADARRMRTLRAELETELRERLPSLVRALHAEHTITDAELEALFTALFESRAP